MVRCSSVCLLPSYSSLLGSCYAVHINALHNESIHRTEEHASSINNNSINIDFIDVENLEVGGTSVNEVFMKLGSLLSVTCRHR